MIRRLHRRRSFGKRCENLGSAFPVILTMLRLVHGSQIAACLCLVCTYDGDDDEHVPAKLA